MEKTSKQSTSRSDKRNSLNETELYSPAKEDIKAEAEPSRKSDPTPKNPEPVPTQQDSFLDLGSLNYDHFEPDVLHSIQLDDLFGSFPATAFLGDLETGPWLEIPNLMDLSDFAKLDEVPQLSGVNCMDLFSLPLHSSSGPSNDAVPPVSLGMFESLSMAHSTPAPWIPSSMVMNSTIPVPPTVSVPTSAILPHSIVNKASSSTDASIYRPMVHPQGHQYLQQQLQHKQRQYQLQQEQKQLYQQQQMSNYMQSTYNPNAVAITATSTFGMNSLPQRSDLAISPGQRLPPGIPYSTAQESITSSLTTTQITTLNKRSSGKTQARNAPKESSSLTSSVKEKPMVEEQTGREINFQNQVCANCSVTSTPLWRRTENDQVLCNACGLCKLYSCYCRKDEGIYLLCSLLTILDYKLHKTNRPMSLKANAAKKNESDEAARPVCANCHTINTPLWRKDEDGSTLCNAWYVHTLFYLGFMLIHV
jgi:hypothetical protein